MTRYTVTNQQATEAFLEPSPDGNWVWYSDAAAELEALQRGFNAVRDDLAASTDQLIKLRTQNRELREALRDIVRVAPRGSDTNNLADDMEFNAAKLKNKAAAELEALTKENTELKGKNIAWVENEQLEMIRKICDSTKHKNPIRDIMLVCRRGQPEIVVLCGSTRFWKTFQEMYLRESRTGKIVLSIGAATGSDAEHLANGTITHEDKDRFDELHKRKIDLADEVLVLNVDGYIGDSTRSEIEYAKTAGKPVRYLTPRWKCDLGNGEFDHDWKEIHDSSGEVDGGPGDHWTQRQCRVCGEIKNAFNK